MVLSKKRCCCRRANSSLLVVWQRSMYLGGSKRPAHSVTLKWSDACHCCTPRAPSASASVTCAVPSRTAASASEVEKKPWQRRASYVELVNAHQTSSVCLCEVGLLEWKARRIMNDDLSRRKNGMRESGAEAVPTGEKS